MKTGSKKLTRNSHAFWAELAVIVARRESKLFSGVIGVPVLTRAISALEVRHLTSPHVMSAAGG